MNDREIAVRFPAETIKFSILHIVQTGSGAHRATSYPVDTGTVHSPASGGGGRPKACLRFGLIQFLAFVESMMNLRNFVPCSLCYF